MKKLIDIIDTLLSLTAISSMALTLVWTVIAVDGKCSFMNVWVWMVIATLSCMTIILRGDTK